MQFNFLKKISGDETFELRHRILNSLFFIFGFYLFATAITNLFIEENIIIEIGTFIASFIFFTLYYFARVKRIFATAHIVAVFALLLLFVYHKYDGGLTCGTGFYIVIEAIGIMAIFRGKPKVFYFSILAVISIILLLLELYYPDYVLPINSETCFVNNILAFILTAICTGLLVQTFLSTYEDYAKAKEQLSKIDPLTGALNRRAFLSEIEEKIPAMIEKNIPFCLIMFDFDHFKEINDTYGHNCGDIVLKKVSKTAMKNLKGGDILCRWGGEEFLIYLPDTNLKQGIVVAERLRKAAENLKIDCKERLIPVSITLGIKEYDPNYSLIQNIEKVDAAMYKGKQSGRNTVYFD